MYFFDGQRQNQGWGDLMQQSLINRIADIQHREFRSTHSRMYFEAHAGRPLCGLMFKTPERETFLNFSLPTTIYPGHRIYFSENFDSRQIRQAQQTTGSISLEQLLLSQSSELKIGIVQGRSYGKVIDGFINTYKNQFSLRSGSNSSLSVFRMFIAGRLDAIIEFPWRFHYQHDQQNLPTKAKGIYSLVITEATNYEAGYVACSQTPAGKRVIEQVNQDIHSIRSEFAKLLVAWLPKASRIPYLNDSVNYFKSMPSRDNNIETSGVDAWK